MKSIIAIIIVISMSIINLFAQNFEEIANIEINTDNLSKELNYQSTQFFTRTNERTDYVYTFNISDIIKPHIANLNDNQLNRLVFIFTNNKNESISATFNQFDKDQIALPAFLTFKKVTTKTGDEISIDESEGELDLQELDETITHFTTRHRIGLQMKHIDKETKEKILSNSTLIFPADLNSKRWLTNIVEIKIYKFVNSK